MAEGGLVALQTLLLQADTDERLPDERLLDVPRPRRKIAAVVFFFRCKYWMYFKSLH